MNHVIEARGLAKSFSGTEAVRGIDLNVAAGEIVGLLGPNGAGKTTTQRMLTTLLRADRRHRDGRRLRSARDPLGVRRRIGYVSQGGGTNPSSRSARSSSLQARLYGVSTRHGRHARASCSTRSTSPAWRTG